MKIKIFSHPDYTELERQVNEWLNEISAADIESIQMTQGNNYTCYSVMIGYEPHANYYEWVEKETSEEAN